MLLQGVDRINKFQGTNVKSSRPSYNWIQLIWNVSTIFYAKTDKNYNLIQQQRKDTAKDRGSLISVNNMNQSSNHS